MVRMSWKETYVFYLEAKSKSEIFTNTLRQQQIIQLQHADRFNGVSKNRVPKHLAREGDFSVGQAMIVRWMLWFAREPEICPVCDPSLKFLSKRP
jgi:hypothetical protein